MSASTQTGVAASVVDAVVTMWFNAETAVFDVAALMWMELSMFAVAAVVYMMFLGALPNPLADKRKVGKALRVRAETFVRSEKKLLAQMENQDPEIILKQWQQMKSSALEGSVEADLARLVGAMRRLGKSTPEVLQELTDLMDCQPKIAQALPPLLDSLLKDDLVRLAIAVVDLMAERHLEIDPVHYASLMAAQLRHRDYSGVAATAERVPQGALNSRMRATLAAAAASRGRLDEALGQLRQMEPGDGSRSVVPPASAARILALGVGERRVLDAATELVRVRARIETRAFDELLIASQRYGVAGSRELLDASDALGVVKSTRTFELLVGALMRDSVATHRLLAELERCRGTAVSEPLCLALFDASVMLKDGDLAERALKLHRAACADCPGPKALGAACRALIVCDRPVVACDLFENEALPRGLRLDPAVCDQLMKTGVQIGRSSMVQSLYAAGTDPKKPVQTSSGAGASANTDLARHATMIKAYAQERDLQAASMVFNRLRESGLQLTSMVYNCFLDACVHCGDLEAALAHFNEMRNLGFSDIVGHNTMLKAYLSKGKLEDAQKLVGEIKASGLRANKVTYNELLHAKVMERDRQGVWKLVDEMRTEGVTMNSVTCSILLKALTPNSQAVDVERTLALVDEIEEEIDEILFSSVIEACIRIRQLSLLSELMRKYKKKGGFGTLTAPTYASMIKAYGQARDITRVRELWADMEERGVKPTAITLGCMTEALVANNLPQEALDLLHEQLKNEERKPCINTVIYSTILKGFAMSKQIERVFTTYHEMQNTGIACNTITYNTMLDACAKCCCMDRVPQLFEDMKASLVEPDIITYSTIVKGYCLEGDIDRGFQVLEEMKKDDKLAPDEIMYNSLLDGCAKQHRVDDALRVLDEMQALGVTPSNYTLSILVKLLGRARRLSQAFRVVEQLSGKHGFRPNVQVYTCLVQACVLNRKLQRASSLHDTMVGDDGCPPDEKFYSVLARGCLQLGGALQAEKVVRAAYLLPGNEMARPKSTLPTGMEIRVVEEVVARLRRGDHSEQTAAEALVADLQEHRAIRVDRRNGSREGMPDGGAGPRASQRGGRGGRA